MPTDRELIHRLDRSREFLRENLSSRITLGDAADVACISPYHYQRLFRRHYGMSPKDFLTLQRRFEAKRMLLEDASSVSEICLAVGYESLGTFSTRFREATGLSPSEFRRQARRCHAFGEIWTYKFVPHCFVIGPHSSERSARNEKRLLLGPT